MRQYGSKRVSKVSTHSALRSLLVMRDDLSTVDLASLSRSYGVAVPEIDRLIAEERQRRERRA